MTPINKGWCIKFRECCKVNRLPLVPEHAIKEPMEAA